MAADVVVAASLQVNGDQAAGEVNKVNKEIANASSSMKGFRAQLREANDELAISVQKYGENSKQAAAAAQKVGELKNQMADAAALAEQFNTDGSKGIKAFGTAVQGVAGAYGAVTGAISLLGIESADVQKTLVKLQAAMAVSQGITQVGELKKTFTDLGTVLKSNTVIQGIYNFVMTGTVAATEAETVATEEATVATTALGVAMRTALIATGIGAVVVGIIALVAAMKSAKEEAAKLAQIQKNLNEVHVNAAKSVAEEKLKIEELLLVARNHNETLAKRKAAVQGIIDLSPEHLKGLTLERIETDKGTEAINKYIAALDRKAIAQAYNEKLVELQKQKLDEEGKNIEDNITGFDRLLAGFNADSDKREQIRQQKGKERKDAAVKDIDDQIQALKKKRDADIVNGTAEVDLGHQGDELNEAAIKRFDKFLKAANDDLKAKEDLAAKNATLANENESAITNIHLKALKDRLNLLESFKPKALALGKDYYDAYLEQVKTAQKAVTDAQNTEEINRYNNTKAVLDKTHKLRLEQEVADPRDFKDETGRFGQIDTKLRPTSTQDINTGADKIKQQDDLVRQNQNNQLDNASKGYKEQLDAVNDFYHEKLSLVAGNADAEKALEEDVARQKKKIAQDEHDFKLGLVASFADQAADIIGKNTIAGKALAIAAGVINTYLGATKALATLPPPFSFIQAGLTIAAGLKSVSSIISTQVPGQTGGGGNVPSSTSVSAPLTPAVNPVATSTNLNQDQLNKIGNAASAKTYVLDSDIQNNRERDARLNRAARLGG